ncbi:MAG: response regulator, partial [Candidatus Anammoxibacter sp.]
ILIVDDDKVILQQLEILINAFGHTPIPTVYAAHVLDILDNEPVDLVLTDIYMPEIDGLRILKQLKAHQQYQSIPVIMLTSDTNEKTLEECFEAGAVDFITKPLKEVVIRARIKSALSNKDHIEKLEGMNTELQNLNDELKNALSEIKTLKGLLPICSSCKKIRLEDEDPRKQDSWISMESYISDRSEVNFSHGICPECVKKLYPEI